MRVGARRRGRVRKGAVALECALVLPFFMMVVLGIIECGQVMSAQEVLTNATREGARLASLGGATIGSNSSSGANEVNYRVRSYLAAGGITTTAVTITVTDLDGTVSELTQADPGDRIQVSASFKFSSIAWSPPWYFGSAVLSSSSIMRKEFP